MTYFSWVQERVPRAPGRGPPRSLGLVFSHPRQDGHTPDTRSGTGARRKENARSAGAHVARQERERSPDPAHPNPDRLTPRLTNPHQPTNRSERPTRAQAASPRPAEAEATRCGPPFATATIAALARAMTMDARTRAQRTGAELPRTPTQCPQRPSRARAWHGSGAGQMCEGSHRPSRRKESPERGYGSRCVLVLKALAIGAMLGRLGDLRLTGD